LLRLFDQIRFNEVDEAELLRQRQDFPLGRFDVRIEQTSFSLADYNRFLEREAEPIAVFKRHQQAAFNAERERWIASGQAEFTGEEAAADDGPGADLPDGGEYLTAEVPGSVWQILAEPGQTLNEGDVIAIFESMKMEISLRARHPGVLSEWLVAKGTPVNAGQRIAIFTPHTPD
ncbi:MAG TPA: acetyl-CoA carboxylase biotin carboxyl carrier protein subunit, partial [Duganella sp.]|uniref:acetyl-CoA carboxylase biotin carboxyl carrier protein subunit n=1 Tax=Duganella sp. TaxID=1904440 RepID=UPI002ED0C9E4